MKDLRLKLGAIKHKRMLWLAGLTTLLVFIAVGGWFARSTRTPDAPQTNSNSFNTQANERLSRACDQGTTDEDEQQCLLLRAALGHYQEIIDAVEVRRVGLKPYQEYFIGIAYFALANRTIAPSLRCFRLERARIRLQNFLNDRKINYGKTLGFGTADEMKYTYIAGRALQSVKEANGCDEPAESLVSLQGFGANYLTNRIESLFFNYGTSGAEKDPLTDQFEAGIGQARDAIMELVSYAAQLETDYGLTEREILGARRELQIAVDAVNAWQKDTILEQRDPTTHEKTYVLGPGLDQLRSMLAAQHAELASLSSVPPRPGEKGGRLYEVKKIIDGIINKHGAGDREDFAKKRNEAMAKARSLIADFTTVTEAAQGLLTMKAAAELKQPRPPVPAQLQAIWAEIEKQWRTEKLGCKVNPNKWFCS